MTQDLTRSLRLCWPDGADFDPQTTPYAVSLLGKLGRRPDPSYTVSPTYRRHWAEVETGRLLGRDVASAASALEKEIYRLEVEAPKMLAQAQENDRRRLAEDPDFLTLEAKIAALSSQVNFTRAISGAVAKPPQEAAE